MRKLRYRPLSDVSVEYDRPLFFGDAENRVFDRVDRVWSDERSVIRLHASRAKIGGRLTQSMAFCAFYESVSESEVIRAASEVGCAVATIAEVLAFVRAYPQEQLHGPILALGSFVADADGEALYPLLTTEESALRVLAGARLSDVQCSRCRFLLVRATVPSARFAPERERSVYE